jgi:hypothetical protein
MLFSLSVGPQPLPHHPAFGWLDGNPWVDLARDSGLSFSPWPSETQTSSQLPTAVGAKAEIENSSESSDAQIETTASSKYWREEED